MKKFHTSIVFFALLGLLLLGKQSVKAQSNIVDFTPSALFEQGQYEVQVFHNIYTQKAVRNRAGEKVSLNQRQTFLNGTYQFTYGVSPSAKFNIGLDINATRAFYDNDQGSPFKALSPWEKGDSDRTIITTIGPRIKFNPVKSLPRLSVQSTFLIPVAKDQETPFFTNHDRYTWLTEVFFDKTFARDFQIFLATGFLYRINRRSQNQEDFFRVPLSVFLSYFPSQKISLYTFGQYSPRFETVSNGFDEQFGLSQRFTQFGAGIKYQATERLGLETSYGNFVNSRLDGAGSTFNFIVRYIRR